MAEFFIDESDYNEIYKSPEEAAEMMEVEEGDTFSLLRVEVVSCTTFKIIGGTLVAQSISFPDGELSRR